MIIRPLTIMAPRPAPPIDPYNPLGLPPNTVRVRTSDGNAPNKEYDVSYETATLVEGTTCKVKNVKVGGFTTLARAQAWT